MKGGCSDGNFIGRVGNFFRGRLSRRKLSLNHNISKLSLDSKKDLSKPVKMHKATSKSRF